MEAMGRAGRAEYDAKYRAERNYEILMQIYKRAITAGSHLTEQEEVGVVQDAESSE